MGQTMGNLPPNHRPGEHYQLYDANAWRRLSWGYLNQLVKEGQLSPEELELIELDRYWHQRRKRRKKSPVQSYRRRRGGGSSLDLATSTSVGHIPSGGNLVKYGGRRPLWKTLQDSSHSTKNHHLQYHSQPDLSSIKPNKDSLRKLQTNLREDDNSNDGTNQSSTFEHESFESKRSSPDSVNESETKKYPKYFPKLGNATKLRSCMRDSSSSPRDSLDRSFTRSDTPETSNQTYRSFTPAMIKSERKVGYKEESPSSNSSFHRRQRLSNVPEFRISSQERLDQSNQPSLSNNRVHFNETKHYKTLRYDDDDDYDDENDDDFPPWHHASKNLIQKRPNGKFDPNYKELARNSQVVSPDHHPKHIAYNGYFLDTENLNYPNYYQSFDRPHLGYTKIIYVTILILNIGFVIWNSIYMHFALINIKLGEPISGRLYDMTTVSRHIWQGIVIAVQILNCFLSMFAIYATLRHKYYTIWILTILFYLIASFASYTELLRGSISAWLVPTVCGYGGTILSHQLAIKHFSI